MLFITQVLIERRDDLNERAHDVRKEGNPTKEDEDAHNHFLIRLGI